MLSRIYKIVVTLILMMTATLNLSAQLSVMGIEISTTTEFNEHMKQKKYKGKKYTDSTLRFKKVTFAGYKPCGIVVKYDMKTDSILSVSIRFPQYFYPPENPRVVMNEILYFSMCEQLEQKYGKNYKEDNSSSPSSNPNDEPFHIMRRIWSTPNGQIDICYTDFGRVVKTFGDTLTGEEYPIIRNFVDLTYTTNIEESSKQIIVSPDI